MRPGSGANLNRVLGLLNGLLLDEIPATRTYLRMGLGDEELDTLVTAASLHDVGKIGVSDPVLLKAGRLTEEEFAEIGRHPKYGWMVLRNARRPNE